MRKKFLIKPGLQLRYLAWTLGVMGLCLLGSYLLFESLISKALLNGPIDHVRWMDLRGSLRLGFSGVFFMVLAAIGIENYLFFHSVAGPLYALERGLRRLSKGQFRDVTRIRETDQLAEVIQAFEEMRVAIQARIEAQEANANVLARELDRLVASASTDNLDAVRSKLKEIRAQVEKKAA